MELLGDPSLSHKTYTYTEQAALARIFEEFASIEKPWSGEKTWTSIEDDFSMKITCSNLGQVKFEFKFWQRQGSDEESKTKVNLITELGMLPKISKQANDFFS
jgi:hypothetical protein